MKLSFYLENVYDADLFLEKGSLMIFFKCTSSETEMKKKFYRNQFMFLCCLND